KINATVAGARQKGSWPRRSVVTTRSGDAPPSLLAIRPSASTRGPLQYFTSLLNRARSVACSGKTLRPLFIRQCGSHWHLGCFMEIMKLLAPFLPLVFGLFSPFLFAANPAVSPGDSDKVTGTAI